MKKDGLNEDLKSLLDQHLLTVNADHLLTLDMDDVLENNNDLLFSLQDGLSTIPRREVKEANRQNSFLQGLMRRKPTLFEKTNKKKKKSKRHSDRASAIENVYRRREQVAMNIGTDRKMQTQTTSLTRLESVCSDDSQSLDWDLDDIADETTRQIISFVNSEKSRARMDQKQKNQKMHQIVGSLRVNINNHNIID